MLTGHSITFRNAMAAGAVAPAVPAGELLAWTSYTRNAAGALKEVVYEDGEASPFVYSQCRAKGAFRFDALGALPLTAAGEGPAWTYYQPNAAGVLDEIVHAHQVMSPFVCSTQFRADGDICFDRPGALLPTAAEEGPLRQALARVKAWKASQKEADEPFITIKGAGLIVLDSIENLSDSAGSLKVLRDAQREALSALAFLETRLSGLLAYEPPLSDELLPYWSASRRRTEALVDCYRGRLVAINARVGHILRSILSKRRPQFEAVLSQVAWFLVNGFHPPEVRGVGAHVVPGCPLVSSS